MSKIKEKKRNNINSIKHDYMIPVSKMCFGFSYLTSNKHYGIDHFSKIGNNAEVYNSLIRKFSDLSGIDIHEARLRGKKLGLEKIPYKQLSKPMQQICIHSGIVSGDSKLCVFRFFQHKYRLICKDDDNHPNIMHVLAFDLDHSAYDHG